MHIHNYENEELCIKKPATDVGWAELTSRVQLQKYNRLLKYTSIQMIVESSG